MTRIAKEVTGKVITANVVALGAIGVLSQGASTQAIKAAILEHFPENLHDINIKAFDAGVAAAEELL